MKAFLRKIRKYIKITGVTGIARRYFVINSFDGVMVILSLLLSSLIFEFREIHFILQASLSAMIATCLSGVFGAYFSEKAEREEKVKMLERSMLKKLGKTLIGKAERFAVVYIAFIDGFSPLLLSSIAIIPLIICSMGLMELRIALLSSTCVAFAEIFFLGMFLGKIARKNPIIEGLKVMSIGIILSLILALLEKLVF